MEKPKRQPLTPEQKERMLIKAKETRAKNKALKEEIKNIKSVITDEVKTSGSKTSKSLTSKLSQLDDISKKLDSKQNIDLSSLESQIKALTEFVQKIADKEKDQKEPIKTEEDKPLEIEKSVEVNLIENEPIPEYMKQQVIELPEPINKFNPINTSKRIHSITSLFVNNNDRSIYKGVNQRKYDNVYKNPYSKKK
jgi:hypothetical protein